MATKRWILLILAAMLALVLAGCNSGSTSNLQNPPPPPTAGVSIAFQPTPPASIPVNTTTQIVAVVSNDSSNGGTGSGVDWTVTCQSGTCGTVSPTHTASGQPTTYTAPPALAGNTEVINIEGFATTEPTKNVLASLSITAFGNNLSGTYVFQAQGSALSSPYQIAGVVALDGNGNITSGQQTVNFFDPTISGFTSLTSSVSPTGSSYFLGPDGRGTITINPTNPGNDPSIVPQTFSLIFLSNAECLIAAIPNSAISNSASGTLTLQSTNIATPSGGYAFVVTGTDFTSGQPAGIGGILNIDNQPNNPNNISGAGSVADQNIGGVLFQSLKTPTGTVSGNSGIISLTLNVPVFSTPSITLTGYMVDSSHISLIESDNAGVLAGTAIGQGAATGTFTTDSAFSGTYVFEAEGVDIASGQADTLTAGGVVSPNGAGVLMNGFTDLVFQFLTSPNTGGPAQISTPFTGPYTILPTGDGRTQSSFNFPTPNYYFHPNFTFYLTGNGNPALVLASGNASFPFVAAGLAYPQAPAPITFTGNYGLNFNQQNGSESDGTGPMSVTSSSLSGFADVGFNLDQSYTGTVGSQTCSPAVTGCFPGSFSNATGNAAFTGTNASNPNNPVSFTADFYMIDSNHGFFVENDLLAQSPSQVSFGYFATATLPTSPSSSSSLKKRNARRTQGISLLTTKR